MLKKFTILLLMIFFINSYSSAYANDVVLENGTKLRLKLVDSISTASNYEGDQVNFIISEDVKLGDLILIKEGTRATGIISLLNPKHGMGKGGKLVINFDSTKAVDGTKVSLTGTITRNGEDKPILLGFPPLSYLFLFVEGFDAGIPAGYQAYARVDKEVILKLNDSLIPVSNIK